MMRLTWASVIALLISAPTIAQQTGRIPDYARSAQPTAPVARVAQAPAGQNGAAQNRSTQNQIAQGQVAQGRAGDMQPRVARADQNRMNAPAPPFPPLGARELAHLQSVLKKWEAQSQGTKTLECSFKRWHFDGFAAPQNVHATFAEGVIKYAKPDRGLFRVDTLVFFKGMENGKPAYASQPGKFGEHWVCNGKQLIEFDEGKKECRIQELPPQLQGQQIFNSPLPFVFNLKADEIQARYWVRQVAAPSEDLILIEAWPKLQEDRAQYRLVQVALNKSTFLPHALIMYAPNFHPKTAPRWDHYEFVDVKRNLLGQTFNQFIGNFIPKKPPANWTILKNVFRPPGQGPPQQAANNPARR